MMYVQSFTNKSRVVVVGAIDNKIADFADDVVSKYNNTLFICTGDMCLGRGPRQFQDMELEYLEQVCAKNDNIVCSIRGDRDNPLYFNLVERLRHLKSLEDYLKHIVFVEDYNIISTIKGNILCVGGGSRREETDSVIPIDPATYIKEGVIDSAFLDGEELRMIDMIPKMEDKETEDGDIVSIDTNPFNNWLKMNSVTMVMSHIPPSLVVFYSSPSNKTLDEERTFLTALTGNVSKICGPIKSWFFSSSNEESEDKVSLGTTFFALGSAGQNSNFKIKEIE